MPRVLARHDLTVLRGGGDAEIARQRVPADHEGVVARCGEGVGQPGEDAPAVVPDGGCLAVHWPPGPHDRGAVGRPDALVAEADPENGNRGPEAPHDLDRDPGLGGGARARRDDDVRRPQRFDVPERRGVVTADDGILPQLAHVTGQGVDEGVVVGDEQDHEVPASAAITPPALSSVSWYSCSGSESATIPPPT